MILINYDDFIKMNITDALTLINLCKRNNLQLKSIEEQNKTKI